MKVTITIEMDEKEVKNIIKEDEKVEKTYGKYARVFDSNAWLWHHDSEYSKLLIKQTERYLNDLLSCRRVVSLNDVYEALGLPKTSERYWVGCDLDNPWTDGFVEISFDPIPGKENEFMLDFNVDGIIGKKRGS